MRIFYNTRLDDSFLWNFWLSLSRTFFLLSVNDFHFADLGLWLGDKTLSIFGFLAFSDTAKKPVRKAVIATVEVMSIAGMIPYSLALVQALGRSKLRGLNSRRGAVSVRGLCRERRYAGEVYFSTGTSVQTGTFSVTSNVNSCSYTQCVYLFPTLHTN